MVVWVINNLDGKFDSIIKLFGKYSVVFQN